MNDIFENTETIKENEHPVYTAESVMRGISKLCATSLPTACWTPVTATWLPAAWPVRGCSSPRSHHCGGRNHDLGQARRVQHRPATPAGCQL